MNPFEIKKAKEGAKTLISFFDQFGTLDEQSIIVLDYIFQLLLTKEVSDEQGLYLPRTKK